MPRGKKAPVTRAADAEAPADQTPADQTRVGQAPVDQAVAMPDRVGLLFVHGIGEQKRFDHLKSSVAELAELMSQGKDGSAKIGCSVVDRTADWPHPPGVVDPAGTPPITLTIKGVDSAGVPVHVEFDCCEVWWADLGARSGVMDSLKFWLWGFGQWAAPVYRELDAAQLTKSDIDLAGAKLNKSVSTLVRLPVSVAGDRIQEPFARFQLWVAALIVLLLSVTWVLAKRVLSQLLDTAPSPTLLVQYVGDVRTFESRATPGDSAVSDPGYPRRVGIRRRMVTEMVAMGAQAKLDRWYVVAHSQGTVLAYNGLTEIGHTLPNYLPKAQWDALDGAYRSDAECALRGPDEIPQMMPGRPDWLDYANVVNRPKLFDNLAGFLTYGSPLNKFAGLWPRIVATAVDRLDEENPFPGGCRWINLRTPQDPVAGSLSSFTAAVNAPLAKFLPSLTTVETPLGIDYVLAHIRYFSGTERFAQGRVPDIQRGVAHWLARNDWVVSHKPPMTPIARWGSVGVVYICSVFVLLVVAAAFAASLGGITQIMLGGETERFAGPYEFLVATAWLALPLINIAMAITLLAGSWRWLGESRLNLRQTEAAMGDELEKLQKPVVVASLPPHWQQRLVMHRRHHRAAFGFFWLALVLSLVGTTLSMTGLVASVAFDIAFGAILAALSAAAAFIQTQINAGVERVKVISPPPANPLPPSGLPKGAPAKSASTRGPRRSPPTP